MSSNRKIAKACVRGNKKQNRILYLGICSLCVFSILILMFQASFLKYRQEEVLKKYGAWSGAIYDGDSEIYKFLTESNDVKRLGTMRLLEDVRIVQEDFSAYIGIVDREAVDLGRISIRKGHFPEHKNEIALEQYLAEQFYPEAEIGDSISVPVNSTVNGGVTNVDFILSGITDEWGRDWNTANHSLPKAFISAEHPLTDSQHEMTYYFFLGDPKRDYAVDQLESILKTHTSGIYVYNTSAYSTFKEVENKFFEQLTFVSMICGLSFLVICFLLSLVLSSLRYRVMIMRHLGAEILTVCSVFMWEAFYLWRVGMLLGIGVGGLCVGALIGITKWGLHLNLPVAIHLKHLGIALLFLSVVFLLSYFLITLDAILNQIHASQNRNSNHIKTVDFPCVKKIKPMTIPRLYQRFFRFYPKQSLLKIGASIAAVLIINLNVIAFFVHYDRYQDIEPDYNYSLVIYDMDKCLDSDQIKRIEKIPGILSVKAKKELYQQQNTISVSWDGWSKSPYINTLRENGYGDDSNGKEKDYYCLNSMNGFDIDNSELIDWYKGCIDEGAIDLEKFKNGEQCILFLSPFYLQNSEMIDKIYEVQPIMDTASLDKVSAIYEYETDGIKPGDFVTVHYGSYSAEVEVAGIVRGITGFPPPPLTGVCGAGDIAVSERFIEKIVKISPTQYNDIEIESYANADHSKTAWQLVNLLETFLGDDDGEAYFFSDHREDSEIVRNIEMSDMVKPVFIIVITLLILGFVFYQETTGKLRKEEKRIHILHALGMPKRRIKAIYWLETALEGLCSGVVGMLLAGFIQFQIWKRESGYSNFSAVVEASQKMSPANGYIIQIYAVCFLLYFIIYVLMVVVPMRRVFKCMQNTREEM